MDLINLRGSLYRLSGLHGYNFKRVENPRSNDIQTGLIAQEVQKLFPELVEKDGTGFLSANYVGMVPHLIEALKEQQREIDEIKIDNAQLKASNQNLTSRVTKIDEIVFLKGDAGRKQNVE